MAEKLYRSLALLAATGIFFPLHSSSALASTISTELERTHPVQSATVTRQQTSASTKAVRKKPSIKKKQAHIAPRKDRLQSGAFVSRCRLILEDAVFAKEYIKSRGKVSGQPFIGMLRSVKGAEWITGSVFRKEQSVFDIQYSTASNGSSLLAMLSFPPSPAPVAPETAPTLDEFFDGIYPYPLTFTACSVLEQSDPTLDWSGTNGLGTDFDFSRFQETLTASPDNNAASPFVYQYQIDTMAVNAGVSWINDLGGTNDFATAYKEAGFADTSNKLYGLTFNLGASYRAFSLTGGYIRALDSFAPTDLSPEGNETDPGAWTGELAYTTTLLHKETVLAVEYQKATESLQVYLPEERYTSKASMVFPDGTTVSLEYYLDKDFSVEDGGNDDEGYGITTRVGFEF